MAGRLLIFSLSPIHLTWQSDMWGGVLTMPQCGHTRCWVSRGWGSSPGGRRRWPPPGRCCSGSAASGAGWSPPEVDTWPVNTAALAPGSNCLKKYLFVNIRKLNELLYSLNKKTWNNCVFITVISTLDVILLPIKDGASGTVQVGHCPDVWAAGVFPEIGHDDVHWNHQMMFTWHWWPGGDSWGWSQSHWGWRWGRAGTHRWMCQSPPAWRRWCSVCSESCAGSSRQPNLQNNERFFIARKNGIAHQNSHCKKFNLYNPLWGKQRALNTFHQYTFSQRHIFIPLPLHCCFLYVFATLSCYSNVAPLRIALQSGERKKV